MTTVAVLGLGEAGGRLAADLLGTGVQVRGYDPVASSVPDGVVRASDPESAVRGADLVLCLTTAAAARGAASSALPALRPDVVYADLNSASPELKRELAALVEGEGVRFADVALLGPVPTRGLGTPAIASGSGAEQLVTVLAPLGMPVEAISEQPGDAAALKLLRSVFMKGIAAATLESLTAAEITGHRAWLERELGAVIGPELVERLVEGSRRHAARRVDEMEAACELLASLGVEPRVAAASRDTLSALAGKTPPGEPA